MIAFSLDAYLALGVGAGNYPLFGYHNLVSTTSVAASTAASGYPVTNLANPSTFLKWKGTSIVPATPDHITIALGSYTGGVDYVGIARHNLGSSGARVTVLGSTNSGSSYAVTLFPAFTPATNNPLFLVFAANLALTHVRIQIEPLGSIAAEMAVVYCGTLTRAQRKIYVGHTPITYGGEADIATGVSSSGHFLGRVQLGGKSSTQVELANLTPSWYRSTLDPLIVSARLLPFFFAWRPETYPLEVGYCWVVGSPKPTNSMANGMMSVSMSLEGILT